MAYRNLGSLTLDLVAKTGGFTQGMNKAERASDKFQRETRKNMRAVSKAIKTMGLAAVGVGGVITRMALQTTKDIDEIAKTGKRLGIAANEVAGLRLAFELGGSSAEEMQTSLIKLEAEAARGNKAFGRLGVAVKKPNGEFKNSLELLEEVAERFSKIQDTTAKAGIAYDLFGRAGAKIIPVLNGGASAISGAIEKTDAWGFSALSNAAAVEAFRDQMTEFKTQVDGLKISFTIGLLPAMKNIADALGTFEDDASAATDAGKAFGVIISDIAAVVIGAVGALKILGTTIGVTFAALTTESPEERIKKLEDRLKSLNKQLEKLDKGESLDVVPRYTYGEIPSYSDAYASQFRSREAIEKQKKNLEQQLQITKNTLKYDEGRVSAFDQIAQSAQETKDSLSAIFAPTKKITDETGKTGDNLKNNKGTSEDILKTLEEYQIKLREQVEKAKKAAEAEEKAAEAKQKQLETQKAFLNLTKGLLDEDGKRLDTLKQQLEVIKEAQSIGKVSPEAAAAARQGVIGRFATGDMPKSQKDDNNEFLQPFSKALDYDDQMGKLQEYQDARKKLLDQALADESLTREEHENKIKALQEKSDEERLKLQEASDKAKIAGLQQTFGQLTADAKQYAGENSGIYRALFAVQKGFAIANSIIAIQEGIAKAAASGPFPANLAAMASVAAATSSIIATISSIVAPAGMAHEGIDKIPKSGTWLLEKGERVTTANTSERLDRTLDMIANNTNNTNAPITININNDNGQDQDTQIRQNKRLAIQLEAAIKGVLNREKRPGGILT